MVNSISSSFNLNKDTGMNYTELCDKIIGNMFRNYSGHKLDDQIISFMNNYLHEKICGLKATAVLPENVDIKFKAERDKNNVNNVNVLPYNKFTEHVAKYRNRSDFYDLMYISEEDMERDIRRINSDY